MMLNRAALIAAIDNAIANHQADRERYERECAEFQEARLAEWLKDSAPKWSEFMDKARRTLREGKPITGDMLPRVGRFNEVAAYVDLPPSSHKVSPVAGIDKRKIEALRAALDATPDERVSHSALAAIGFRDLSWLFRQATAQAGS